MTNEAKAAEARLLKDHDETVDLLKSYRARLAKPNDYEVAGVLYKSGMILTQLATRLEQVSEAIERLRDDESMEEVHGHFTAEVRFAARNFHNHGEDEVAAIVWRLRTAAQARVLALLEGKS